MVLLDKIVNKLIKDNLKVVGGRQDKTILEKV